MALRKIVKIDEDKCNGCGECIINCPEGALEIVDGKARLVKESYCDGLGACIGKCPLDAITIEEREAREFDEEAVKEHMAGVGKTSRPAPSAGCPGAAMRSMTPRASAVSADEAPSQLTHWPVQLALVPPEAPFLRDADVLFVADCVPFALADFHRRLLGGGHPVLVACPKLDDTEPHVEKLSAMLEQSSLRSLTIVHMEVPCCRGLCRIVETALESTGKNVPVRELTVSVDGHVIAERRWDPQQADSARGRASPVAGAGG